jgi:glycosyltransferase involved in cell wall biosynthesis
VTRPTVAGPDQPLVSVILPTHNRASVLSRAIRSVLAQTYRNLELIVVDDASTDNTPDVIKRFLDSRLRYVRLPQNRRVAAARNVGIREAAGEVLAFLDDDDYWLIQKLERQVPALLGASDDVGLNICGHLCLEPHRTRYIGGSAAFARMDFSAGFNLNFGLIATPGWLVRRGYLRQAGPFDERLLCWEDWELALRLSDVCRFEHLDEPLFVQDRRRTANMGSWDNTTLFADSMETIMSAHSARWASRPEVLSRHYWIIGRSKLACGSARESRQWLLQALRAHPRNLKALTMFCLTLLGRWGAAAGRAGLTCATRLQARLQGLR